MKKLFSCLFLLSLSLFSSGFGMFDIGQEGQELCIDENSKKWEKVLRDILKDKWDFYDGKEVEASYRDVIFRVGYCKPCKDALIKMFRYFEKQFQAGKRVRAKDLLAYEIEHIAPTFLPGLALVIKFDIKDLRSEIEPYFYRYLDKISMNPEVFLYAHEVFGRGVDFVGFYAYSKLSERRRLKDAGKRFGLSVRLPDFKEKESVRLRKRLDDCLVRCRERCIKKNRKEFFLEMMFEVVFCEDCRKALVEMGMLFHEQIRAGLYVTFKDVFNYECKFIVPIFSRELSLRLGVDEKDLFMDIERNFVDYRAEKKTDSSAFAIGVGFVTFYIKKVLAKCGGLSEEKTSAYKALEALLTKKGIS